MFYFNNMLPEDYDEGEHDNENNPFLFALDDKAP